MCIFKGVASGQIVCVCVCVCVCMCVSEGTLMRVCLYVSSIVCGYHRMLPRRGGIPPVEGGSHHVKR